MLKEIDRDPAFRMGMECSSFLPVVCTMGEAEEQLETSVLLTHSPLILASMWKILYWNLNKIR